MLCSCPYLGLILLVLFIHAKYWFIGKDICLISCLCTRGILKVLFIQICLSS